MGGIPEKTDDCRAPEVILAEAFAKDLGLVVDPQALRIFIRWRWDRVQTLAHRIHDAA
jgi:endonuclease III